MKWKYLTKHTVIMHCQIRCGTRCESNYSVLQSADNSLVFGFCMYVLIKIIPLGQKTVKGTNWRFAFSVLLARQEFITYLSEAW